MPEDIDDVLNDVLFDGQTVPEPSKPIEANPKTSASSVRLVTTTTFARVGHEVIDTLPMIFSRRVYGTSGWTDLKMDVKDTFGGRSTTAEKIIGRIEVELQQELRSMAAAQGATVVAGFRIEIGEFAGRLFVGRAYGTPLMVRDIDAD